MPVAQQETARHPGAASVPPPRRGGARLSGVGLLIAVSMGIFTWMVTTSFLPRTAPAADVAVTPPPDLCANAVERVQTYQAPAQREPVADALTASLAAEALRYPVAVVAWEPAYVWHGDCEVGLQVSIGNELTTLRWVVRTDTGRVEAMNDLAKRMSGW